ncbi:macrolide resistance MFS transporter Mrx(A) [Nonomuraea maheshkhaliensis]|uniref:Multidrug efflux pump Tap n=1 Tax=Nonomuraea maheshkhaliensis TaxID=419590 RepID=A0ABN2GTM8_9ACTN
MNGRLRPLAGVLAATAVALTGTRVSAIALPWYVLGTTGSAAWTGVVAFAEMVPYVLVKALTGPLVDRVGPRRISLAADVVSAAAAGAVVLLHTLGALPMGALIALVVVIGAGRGPGDLAKEIMIPEAAGRAGMPLERATGLMGVTERLAQTVGPAAGGAVVGVFGALPSLGLSAVFFAVGSVIVAWALPRGMGHRAPEPVVGAEAGEGATPASPRETAGNDGYWRRFGEGMAFLRGEPLLLILIAMVCVTNLLDAAFGQVLGPVWAKESGHGPVLLGLCGSVMGLTAVGGSLVAAAVAHRLPRRPVLFVAFLIAGPPRFLLLAFDLPVAAIVAVFAVGGFAGGFLNPILGAVSFERVPRHLLGRVGGLQTSLSFVGVPLGGLLAGAAVTVTGLAPVLLACGAAYVLAIVLTGLRPEWREMDLLRARSALDGSAGERVGVRER